MGLSIKGAGIAVGGLTAIWLANKLLNVGKGMVHDITNASKWKAYYRCGDPYVVPPGYSRTTYKDSETGENIVIKSPKEQTAEKNQEQQNNLNENRQKVDISGLSETAEKIARAYFKAKGVDLDQPEKKINGPCRYNPSYEPVTYADFCKKEDNVHTSSEKERISELFDENKQSPAEKLKESIRSFVDTNGDQNIPTKEEPYAIEPYVISLHEFFEKRKDYSKSNLYWYEDDDVVVDETEEIVPDPKSYVGVSMYDLFDIYNPYVARDPDIVYVRNDERKTDYEVVRYHGSYGAVIGNDISKDEIKGDEDK